MTDSNPYRAPSANVADMVDPAERQLAGRWTRFGAAFIDGLAATPITLPIAYGLGVFDLSGKHHQTAADTIIMALVAYVVFVILQTYFLAKSGQTIGKKVVGIRIVDLDGKRPALNRLLGFRYGAVYLFNAIPIVGGLLALADILFIFRADRRCLHDLIAGTRVVQNSPA